MIFAHPYTFILFFIMMADTMEQQLRDDQIKIIFGDNPHREGTKIFKTFEAAKKINYHWAGKATCIIVGIAIMVEERKYSYQS